MADNTEKNKEIGTKIANAFVARQNPTANARTILSDATLWAEIAGILAGDKEEAAPEEAPAEEGEEENTTSKRSRKGR